MKTLVAQYVTPHDWPPLFSTDGQLSGLSAFPSL